MPNFAHRVLPFAVAAMATIAAPAHAQLAGSYVATSASGERFEILAQSFDGGATLTLTQYDFATTLKCPSGAAHAESWAFGVWTPATAHVEDDRAEDGLSSHLAGDFSADGSTFTGTITFKQPMFVDLAQFPNKAEVCGSGTRRVVATWQPMSLAKQPVQRGQALRLGR